jgi:GGDEF domain-containing protein
VVVAARIGLHRFGQAPRATVRTLEEGDRLRRLSAIMRFVSQMRDSASEQELVQALVQAAAVWYDLDARAYRRELSGRYALEMWLPGADVGNDPREMDVNGLLSADGPTHVSSVQELEQLGWRTLQGEVLLLPIPGTDVARWLIAVAGTVEREVETTLMLVCRSAGAVIDQLTVRRGREVQDRLVRRMTEGPGAFAGRARAVLQEYLATVGASAGRVSMRPAHGRTLPLVALGDGWTSPVPQMSSGSAETRPDRMAFALGLGPDASLVVELRAFDDAPFGVEQAHTARAGAGVLGTWLAGVWTGAAGQVAAREVDVPATPPFEQTMEGELEKAKRLNLNGGVLVASVPGAGGIPDAHALAVVIQTVRHELRSSDLLGQLSGGDIAAVLVRTSADGVATAAGRVRQRLDALARERQVPPVVVGHALYPAGGFEPPAVLIARARREAGLLYS